MQINNPHILKACYLSNNNFAYKWDTKADWQSEIKVMNFVPTYDKWCLYCGNKSALSRCSGCKSVYFCGRECAEKGWKIHKRHCKRDLFVLCATCGKGGKSEKSEKCSETSLENPIRCPSCPVKFCSEQCRQSIFRAHQEFDCQYFAKTFL